MNLKYLLFSTMIITFSLSGCQLPQKHIQKAENNIEQYISNNYIETPNNYHNEEENIIDDFEKITNINDYNIVDCIYNEYKGNILYSPVSLKMVLSLISKGVDLNSESKIAIDKFINDNGHFEENTKIYNYNGSDESETINIFNSIWINKKYEINQIYKDKISEIGVKTDQFDLNNKLETVNSINKWVEESTNGKIKKIIDTIDDSSRAIFINTLYFDSKWKNNWEKEEEIYFVLFDETMIPVPALSGKESIYFENGQAMAFSKDYKLEGIEFIGILPKKYEDFSLEELNIPELLDSRKEISNVNIKIPSLMFDSDIDFSKLLMNTSLEPLFLNEDFKDILMLDEKNIPIGIDKIIQKTTIEFNIDGTTAAAATYAETLDTCINDSISKNLDFNRPFAFLIYDRNNKEILFAGKIVNPSEVKQ